ncbi:MAG: MmgE/PrpD family protein [Caulobacteraceae bacterium]
MFDAPSQSLTRDLARFVARSSYDDLDPRTVEMTKASFLDALGVMLAASGLGEGCKPFADLAMADGGRGESTLLGFGGKVPASAAALVNGALSHALDYEDAYDGAPVHPNGPTVPAALAVAEALGDVSGRDLIAALATGCDLVCRLGLSVTENPDAYGWFPPPIFGAFGACAAAAKLLKLDEEQIVDAFALTLFQTTASSQFKWTPHATVRAVRDAFAAQVGVRSAQLAQRGVRGFEGVFEGKAGLFALFARGAYDPAVLTRNLGAYFHGENISFKAWPACRGTHAFIEAAMELQAEHGFDVDQLTSIDMTGGEVQAMLFDPFEQKRQPQTAIDAKFSLPFTTGVALRYGTVRLAHYLPGALRDVAVLSLAKLAVYRRSDSKNIASGTLTLQLADGRTLSKHIEHPYGHPTNPISEADLAGKFVECASYAARPMDRTAAEAVIATVRTLETAEVVTAETLRLG